MSSLSQVKISENLSASLAYRALSTKAYTNSKPTPIALLELELRYQCNKPLGKCYDDFTLWPEVEGEHYVAELDEVKSEGKFGITASGLKVNVAISRGRGEASLRLVYKLFAKPSTTGTFSYTVVLYLATERERLRVGDPVKLTVSAVKPIDELAIDVEPKSSSYFPGDRVAVSARLYSNYRGRALVVIDGATDKLSEELELSEGRLELVKNTAIRHGEVNYLRVLVKVPEIGFEIERKLEVSISPSKFEVEVLETPGEVFIGERAEVRVRVANKSTASKCLLKLKSKVYEHLVEEELSLDPGESTIVDIVTPVITWRSLSEVKGFVELVDQVSNLSWSQKLTLVKPQLPVVVEVDREHRLYSSAKKYSFSIRVGSRLGTELEVGLSLSQPTICDVTVQTDKLVLKPYDFSEALVELRPRSVGAETLRISVVVQANEVKLCELSEEISLEVEPSFSITKSSVQGTKGNVVTKGQKFGVYLGFEVYPESGVEVKLLSKNLRFSENILTVLPPKDEKLVQVVAVGYGDSVVTVSDGVCSLDLKLPITVVKPEVRVIAGEEVIYGGMRGIIRFEVENPFGVDLKLSVRIDEENPFIRFITKGREVFLKPYARDPVELEVVGLKYIEKESFNALLKVQIDAEGVKEEYELSKRIYFSVKNPVDVRLNVKYSTVHVPILKGTSPTFKKMCTPIGIMVMVKNLTKYFIDSIEVSIGFKELPGKGAMSIKLSLDPGGSKPILVDEVLPCDYVYDHVTVSYKVTVSDYYTAEKGEVKIPVVRYPPLLARFSKSLFKPKDCPYPRIELKDEVAVLIPIGVDLNSIYLACGEPLRLSEYHIKLANNLHGILSDSIRKKVKSVWDAASSLIFKHSLYIKSGFDKEQEVYEGIVHSVNGVDVLPAVLWKITLGKLIKRRAEGFSVKTGKVGLIVPRSEERFQVVRGDFYGNLLKFALHGNAESGAWLYNYIRDSLNALVLDPMYLLYVLNGGRPEEFDERVFESLLKREDFAGLLTYLALTDLSGWVFNERVVREVTGIVGEKGDALLSKGSCRVALSIILWKLLEHFQAEVSKVERLEQ